MACLSSRRALQLSFLPLIAAPLAAAQTPQPFTEEALARGLAWQVQDYPQADGYLGFGVGFVDIDADGDPDVVALGAADGRVGLFENDGTGHFIDRSQGSGVPLLDEASGFAAADYDGDGLLDLYLTQLSRPNVLLRNRGNGLTFQDVTSTARVGSAGSSTGASFGDFDGDGWVDLYVPNYTGALGSTDVIRNAFYRNLGDGTFEDIAVAQGVDGDGYGFQSVWFDYDRDGDLDLYLSNDRGHLPPKFAANRLWRNDGGQLVDVSVESGAGLALFSMGLACGDFDGDLWPDLYATNVGGYEDGFNPLLLGDGIGFEEWSARAGVDQYLTSWGAIFFDYDNDGQDELYVDNMFAANHLFDPSGGFPAAEIGAQVALQGAGQATFSSAVADVDGDGDLDVIGNGLGANLQLYINHEGDQRNSVRLRVQGVGPDAFAIGSSVALRAGGQWQMGETLAGGNGFLGQNELVHHFGVGLETQAESVLVRWPSALGRRRLTNVPAGQTWSVPHPDQLGDGDSNGTCDEADLDALAAAYASPSFELGHEWFDFDGDFDVDLEDAEAFMAVFEGIAPDCDLDGIPDLIQLVGGAADVDKNGVLDTCQPMILALASPDCGVDATHTQSEIPATWMTGGLGVGDFDRNGLADLFTVRGCEADGLFINVGEGQFEERGAAWGLADDTCGVSVAVGDVDDDGFEDVYSARTGPDPAAHQPGFHRLWINQAGAAFSEEALARGVATSSVVSGLSFGAVFGDYDLDGDLDLFAATWDITDQGNRLYQNDGTGHFTDVTTQAIGSGPLAEVWGFQPAFTDMDGDLWPELLLAADFETSRYFVNDGDGTFTDATATSGTGIDDNGMGQTTGDFDNDGRLDWYVTSIWNDTPPEGNTPGNMLYRQTADHVYEELAGPSGTADGGWGWGTLAVDLDADGWLDIVEVNGRETDPPGQWTDEPAKLWRNLADGTFEESAFDCGLVFPKSGRGIVSLDLENDGDLDLVLFENGGTLDVFENETARAGHWLQLRLTTDQHPFLPPAGFGARITVEAEGRTYTRFIDSAPSYLSTSQAIAHFGLGGAEVIETLTVRWSRGQRTVLENVAADQILELAAPVPQDVNADGVVDQADFQLIVANIGAPLTVDTMAGDVNADGVIDTADARAVLIGMR